MTNRKRKGVSWYLGSVSVNPGELEGQIFSNVEEVACQEEERLQRHNESRRQGHEKTVGLFMFSHPTE
jgi:hypothetical protein